MCSSCILDRRHGKTRHAAGLHVGCKLDVSVFGFQSSATRQPIDDEGHGGGVGTLADCAIVPLGSAGALFSWAGSRIGRMVVV